jgi:hypothetical protein
MIKRQRDMIIKDDIKTHRKDDIQNSNKPWKTGGINEGTERKGR